MPTVTLDSGTTQLVADGDLNQATVTEESQAGLNLQPGQDYTLDLAKLNGFDSSGLAYIINLISQQDTSGGSIRLINSPEKVLQLIELSELDDVIPVAVSE